MTLSPGTRLGPYEITGALGAGGMGEVYRARDTKLDRDVAIKVLPQNLARDPERLARFEREAKVLAALNHPNIAQIYGLEESSGLRALVMELVPGKTVAGPLPIAEALRIASQIAEALEAAHDKGIIHRDLKPANVMLTPAGVVKVLDFGLAAVTQPEVAPSSGENSPTLTIGGTQAGMILGTAAYMSPEQAAGQPVDKRADIWAFGVVFYEMLTGQRLFSGDTVAHTLADVLRAPIDFDKLPPATPRAIRDLLRRCLDRDVKTRLRDIGEARITLSQVGQASRPDEPPPQKSRTPWIAAALFAVVALALAFVAFRHATEDPPRLVKLSVLPPERATFKADSLLAVSPDGRRLAFTAATHGVNELWVRDLDSPDARPLPGTEGAIDPFWSPDSRWIAFFTPGKLKKIEVAGGPALTLCDISSGSRGGSWSTDGSILFAVNNGGNFRVADAGGTATPLTEPDRASGEISHRFPRFLPDGRHFLYSTQNTAAEKDGIYVGDIDSKTAAKNRQRVLATNSNAVYAPPGYLLFVRDRTLMAQPFDASKAQTTGDAMPIAEQVDSANFFFSSYQFSVSQNGVLAYTSGGAFGGTLQLSWVDRSGKVTGAVGPPGVYNNFRLAPNEKSIAFDRPDAQSGFPDVWVMDLIRGVTSRLTFDPATDNLPIWSPDGLRILFPNRRTGVFDLYVKAATGAGQEEVLVKMGTPTGWGTHWSRDGRFILYQIPDAKTGQDLWIAPQFGDRKPFPYLHTQFNESAGTFSPDGRWVAYVSDESGRNEVYVQAFPLSGAKWQISTGGGSEPNWRKDGTELFYLAADRNLMAVPVKSGATLEAGVPKSLFPIAMTASRHSYAVANDGQRFLVSTSTGGEKTVPITVVLNWQAGLKK